jgi:hypothetical protein
MLMTDVTGTSAAAAVVAAGAADAAVTGVPVACAPWWKRPVEAEAVPAKTGRAATARAATARRRDLRGEWGLFTPCVSASIRVDKTLGMLILLNLPG